MLLCEETGIKECMKRTATSFLVKWKATFDKALEDHLRHASKDAKFTSSRNQNKIVSICCRIISKIPWYWSVRLITRMFRPLTNENLHTTCDEKC